jgi:hypothetical protein
MGGDRERRVRERAYAIWEREGRPRDREQQNWQEAEQEVAAEEAPRQASSATVDEARPAEAAKAETEISKGALKQAERPRVSRPPGGKEAATPSTPSGAAEAAEAINAGEPTGRDPTKSSG